MEIDQILKLVEAGFSKEEIMQLQTAQPAQPAQPAEPAQPA